MAVKGDITRIGICQKFKMQCGFKQLDLGASLMKFYTFILYIFYLQSQHFQNRLIITN